MLREFDDGRSKSFYCIAATLLPMSDLENSLNKAKQKIEADKIDFGDIKARSKILKEFLNESGARNEVDLRLRRKRESQ